MCHGLYNECSKITGKCIACITCIECIACIECISNIACIDYIMYR